jgi:LysR family glycine cleavage system transcriptional activator
MSNSSSPDRLPPLNALRSFEAAGRLQSIRRAADELCVTPGAVSRQVQVLESWLGVRLFQHKARSVSLTDTGARYLEAVSEHLDGLSAATDEVTGRGQPDSTLLIRSYTFFAANWLVPRLTTFRRGEPWVDLQLLTSSCPSDFGRRDVDAEILPGRYDMPGYRKKLLLRDEVVCVCSPAYRERHRLGVPHDLLRLGPAELLRSVASPRLWREWLDTAGLGGLEPEHGPTYSDSEMTCRAAAAGQGVALAPRGLVETELTSGRLVEAFPGGIGYYVYFYLFYAPEKRRSRAFQTFQGWMMSEIGSLGQLAVARAGASA